MGVEVQIVANEQGEPTAVLVPIAPWREISSEHETAYLLRSESMARRLREALEREEGISLGAALAKLGV